ncbi:glycoside hydrolase family 172 protein [Pedobacter sp. GSP4]|uniref:glycoside hydrolase family 172 protein n=1 Tax=Pedobacter sp. GSP4 TaxID=3453716 RepID=UPI003EF01CE4
MMKFFNPVVITVVLLLMVGKTFGQAEVSLSSLLKEMTARKANTYWPAQNFSTHQASSYDRASVAPDKAGWYGNADFSQYKGSIQKNGRTEQVMLDVDGPGVLVRFWLTTFKRNGVFRIYFDNRDSASLQIAGYDLLKSGLNLGPALLNPHSSYQPTEKGGSTLYLPLPYAKHCRVTWEEKDLKDKQPRYYQINYRTYLPKVKVKTFDIKQLAIATKQIATTEQQLWKPPTQRANSQRILKQTILPGKTAVIQMPKGSWAIDLMKLKIVAQHAAVQDQVLRSTLIKIVFDGVQTVWCPVGDFSGSGVGGKPLQSWYRTVKSDGDIISRWVMPYQKTAEISFINLSDAPLTVDLTTELNTYQWTGSSMYFHASWKQKRNEAIFKWDRPQAAELNFITIQGKGVYLGNSMSVFNHMHTWYGEGDQKIWVDEDKFPSEFGTGTEDYYNTSWAPVVLYQTPFANAPRADHEDSYGYNTFTRTRNLDRIPFKKLFKMDMEMLGWQNGSADFAITTYWYGFAGATDNTAGVAEEAKIILPN